MQVVGPLIYLPFPEDHAVEGVAGHQSPSRRHADIGSQPFVDDAKQPPPRRDHRTDACQLFVTASVFRITDPLHVLRQPDPCVLGNGVVVRPVQVVGPLVNLYGPRLGRLLPGLTRLDTRHSAGRQHADHLFHGNIAEVLGDEEIDEVIRIGEIVLLPMADGCLTVQAIVLDMLSGFGRFASIAAKSVNNEAVVGGEIGHKRAATRSDMHDEPALDARVCRHLA